VGPREHAIDPEASLPNWFARRDERRDDRLGAMTIDQSVYS
jgi:hypothetical protein